MGVQLTVYGNVEIKRKNEHTSWYKWFGWLFGKDRIERHVVRENFYFPTIQDIQLVEAGPLNLSVTAMQGGATAQFSAEGFPIASRFFPIDQDIRVRASSRGVSVDLMCHVSVVD